MSLQSHLNTQKVIISLSLALNAYLIYQNKNKDFEIQMLEESLKEHAPDFYTLNTTTKHKIIQKSKKLKKRLEQCTDRFVKCKTSYKHNIKSFLDLERKCEKYVSDFEPPVNLKNETLIIKETGAIKEHDFSLEHH